MGAGGARAGTVVSSMRSIDAGGFVRNFSGSTSISRSPTTTLRTAGGGLKRRGCSVVAQCAGSDGSGSSKSKPRVATLPCAPEANCCGTQRSQVSSVFRSCPIGFAGPARSRSKPWLPTKRVWITPCSILLCSLADSWKEKRPGCRCLCPMRTGAVRPNPSGRGAAQLDFQ